MQTEQEKIKKLDEAFEKFLGKIIVSYDKEKILFEKVMEKINQRKIRECRGKICEIFKKKIS